MNALLIAVTPIDGGHYFIDVLVGIAAALHRPAAPTTAAEISHLADARDRGSLAGHV